MSKIQKDLSTAVSRADVPGMILEKMQAATDAWDAGKQEDLSKLIDEIMDLGVVMQEFKATPDIDKILLMPGIGAHLTSDSELGATLHSMKDAVAQSNVEAYKAAVTTAMGQLQASPEGEQASGETGNTEGETGENSGGTEAGAGTQAPGQEQPEPQASTEPQTPATTDAPAVPAQKQKASWGFDLAAEFARDRDKEAEAAAAAAEMQRKQKAASFQKPNFDWDKVEGGEFKG